MRKANIIGALIFLAISIYVIAVTFTFKQFKNVAVGPEFFPRYLASGLMICSIVLIYQSVVSKDTRSAPTISLRDKGMQRVLVGLTIIVFYLALWKTLGFLIVTPLALFAFMYLLQVKNYKIMAIIAVFSGTGIFLAFKMILGIEMPLGVLSNIINF
jgi:putative tricarboxylic transport membrane protein